MEDVNQILINFNTVSHEAAHVSLNAFDFLGEKVMQSEPFCYLVGWVAGKCEDVKKGTVRDKLIWESK